ncbi:MAG: peptide deformylase [Chloroflexi bacterium]|nr:peptide deformylase [Chloroflexota bacterium]
MAKRDILVAGEPVLRQKAKKVTSFGPFLEGLVTDMLDTMRAANGLGLAAPQIGVPLRVIVIEMPAEEDEEGNEIQPGQLYVYCNPEIVKAYGEEEDEEGCLSVPGYVGMVKRAAVVTVKGQDLKGRPIRTKAEGLLARAFQHEIDHLDGKLFLDRVESPEKLRRIEPREKRRGQGAEPI